MLRRTRTRSHDLRPKGHNYQIPNYSTELHKRSFSPHSLFQYYWLVVLPFFENHFLYALCMCFLCLSMLHYCFQSFVVYVCYMFIKRDLIWFDLTLIKSSWCSGQSIWNFKMKILTVCYCKQGRRRVNKSGGVKAHCLPSPFLPFPSPVPAPSLSSPFLPIPPSGRFVKNFLYPMCFFFVAMTEYY